MTTTTSQEERAAARWLSAARLRPWRWPVQIAALLAFLAFVILARLPGGAGPLQWLFRADPLASLSTTIASRSLAPGWWLAGLFLLGTLLLGRTWCGWLCPLGALLDFFPAHKARPWDKAIGNAWRRAKWLLLAAMLGMALLGSLTLLILDPITLLTRASAGSLWPAFNWLLTAAERLLYGIPALRPAIASFDGALRGSVLRFEPASGAFSGLAALLLAGVILLNAVRRRFWCRYLCPLGGLLGLVSRASWLRRHVDDEGCLSCKRCSRACPVSTIDPERGYASDPAECILCLECASTCPVSGTSFRGAWGLAPAMAYDPSRRALLYAAGASLFGVALLRSGPTARQPHPRWLLPPGATPGDFLESCIRCGTCIQSCPTGALQSSFGQAGLEGVWTPVVIPRLGYCDYACNACGQACPTGAIPLLALAEKQQQVIGQASIDRGRCLAWAGDQPCIVCEEVCPVPDKAIWLEEADVLMRDGSTRRLQLPHVDRAKCIGCGICENKCPLAGPAAIQVYAPTELGYPLSMKPGRRLCV